MSDAKPTIGFIGLGQMGRPMARALSGAGYPLVLHDVDASAASALADELGAESASHPGEVGRAATIVILMLPNSRIVGRVVLGESDAPGLAAGMAAGGTIIDMSSSDPVETRKLAEALGDYELRLVDAPVSGGVKKAENGTLAILIGGDDEPVDAVEPVLRAMGDKLLRAGPLGAGHTMKALNNFVSAAGLMAASEALRIGTRFGIEPATVVEILNASTGRNNSTENKFPQYVLPESFTSGFSLALMTKDIGIARDLAKSIDMQAPLLDECAREWREAESALPERSDHTAFIRYLDQLGSERG
ncbi:putative 6-phosphogluconate dehydrogenase [Salinisphaera sp. T31B1]